MDSVEGRVFHLCGFDVSEDIVSSSAELSSDGKLYLLVGMRICNEPIVRLMRRSADQSSGPTLFADAPLSKLMGDDSCLNSSQLQSIQDQTGLNLAAYRGLVEKAFDILFLK